MIDWLLAMFGASILFGLFGLLVLAGAALSQRRTEAEQSPADLHKSVQCRSIVRPVQVQVAERDCRTVEAARDYVNHYIEAIWPDWDEEVWRGPNRL